MGSGLKGEKCLINHLLRVVRQLRPADILCRREAAEQGNGMSVMHPALSALAGTGFTCLMTALGAAMVFFFRGEVKAAFQQAFLGFAAGVMIAASVWSLLMPAIEMAEERGTPGWLPAAGGVLIGAVFLQSLDRLLPHLHPGSDQPEGLPARLRRTTMLVFAVTLSAFPSRLRLRTVKRLRLRARSHWRSESVCKTFRKARLSLCRCVRKGLHAHAALSMARFQGLSSRSAVS